MILENVLSLKYVDISKHNYLRSLMFINGIANYVLKNESCYTLLITTYT
jgi:hypothetical protein